MFGIDHSSAAPSPRKLKKAGVKFVCRYVSTPGHPKNITKAEVKALKKAGIDIVLVFETTATRALRGSTAGYYDAKSAREQAKEVGLGLSPIYFAVDFDADKHDWLVVNSYLKGAVAALGHHRVGVYGGYDVVKWALDANVCKYAWQTYAWSYGRWDPRAHIRQYKNGQRLAGIAVDFDEARFPDFGQAPRPLPKRKGLPGPAKKPAWFWLALKQFLKNRGES